MRLPAKNSSMDNYIRTYENVVDVDSCKFLINKFDASEKEFENILVEKDDDKVISFNQINIYNGDSWEGIRDKLAQVYWFYIHKYKEDCNITKEMWPPFEKIGVEAIRIKRYENNDYDRFDDHVDSTDGCDKRFLNMLIYLNDVEEGGETEFPQLQKPGTYIKLSVQPKAGTMVIFPPMWPWLHAGRKPISGRKYFAHSYLHYV